MMKIVLLNFTLFYTWKKETDIKRQMRKDPTRIYSAPVGQTQNSGTGKPLLIQTAHKSSS